MPQFSANLRQGMLAFLRDDSAATAIEYGIITAAMCLVVVVSMGQITNSALWELFKIINDQFDAFTTP